VSLTYLDASAVVKLFKPEAETAALRALLTDSESLVSTELVVVEARCAARRVDPRLLPVAEEVLATIQLISFTSAIRDRAGAGFRQPLRALNAVHAATALSAREDLDAVFVYDSDLRSAIAAEGLPVASPGVSV